MRRLFAILAALVVLVLAALVLIPMVFKDKLVGLVTDEVNARVDARVEVGRAEVHLLSSFPDLTVRLDDLSVAGKGDFKDTRLARVGELDVSVDLGSILGDRVRVTGVQVKNAEFNVLIREDGSSNLDLISSSGDSEGGDAEGGGIDLSLEDVRLQDVGLRYDDRQAGRNIEATGIDHAGRFEVTSASTDISTQTTIASLTYRQDGMTWLKKAKVDAAIDASIDAATGAIAFGQSRVTVNALPLSFSGQVTPKGDDTDLDLRFDARNADFKALLSLVPAVYSKDFAGLDAAGSLSASGHVKGLLRAEGDDLPGFDLAVEVVDGRFKYPDLPSDVHDVQLTARVTHPAGAADLTRVDVKKFHLMMAGSPIDGRLRLAHPITDPDLSVRLVGTVDLGNLAKVIPPEPGTRLAGKVAMDIDLAGKVSDFEAARAGRNVDAVRASGTVSMSGVRYESADLPMPVLIDSLKLTIDPVSLDMANLAVRFGKSDLHAEGTVTDALAYALSDATLRGNLRVTSGLLDLAPFMDDTPDASRTPADDSSLVAVPKNLDLSLDLAADRVVTDEYDLRSVRGKVRVKDGVVHMDGVQAQTLGGRVRIDGTYTAPTDRAADVDLAIDVNRLDLAQTVSKVEPLARIAPITRSAKGRFSSQMRLRTRLGPDLSPAIETLMSKGQVSTMGVTLQPHFLEAVSKAIGNDTLHTLTIENSRLDYRIEKGRLVIRELPVKIAGYEAVISGRSGLLDKTLDLKLTMTLPVSQVKVPDLASANGDKVPLEIHVGGTWSKPKVKLKAADLAQAAAGVAVAALTSNEDILAAAQAQADEIRAAAKKAARKIRQEAKKAGKKLIEKAGNNPIAKAAAQKAAEALEAAADKKAKMLLKEADKKADALIEKAKGH